VPAVKVACSCIELSATTTGLHTTVGSLGHFVTTSRAVCLSTTGGLDNVLPETARIRAWCNAPEREIGMRWKR
jgi:hypothetical protein